MRLAGPFEVRAKSMPVPEAASVCGEFEALLENVTVPVRGPEVVGVKMI